MRKNYSVEIQPVKLKTYHIPCYPKKQEIEFNRLLLEYKPKRWQKAPMMAAILSASVILGLTGCEPEGDFYPLGMAGYPPPYKLLLTEDDAFMVISSEFENIGYEVERDGETVNDVKIPVELLNEGKTKNATINLDCIVKNTDIKMEFISKDDILSMYNETKDPQWLAGKMKKALKAADSNSIYKIFYDPGVSTDETQIKPIKELRKQVKSFIKWLQAEGII